MRGGWLLAVALGSCDGSPFSGGPGPGSVDAAMPDGPYDPNCHIDCFGEVSCYDGVQTVRPHQPIPCTDPSYPYCPMTTFDCPGGCRIDPFEAPLYWYKAVYQRWLCLAEPDAVEGSYCRGEPDCWPTTAIDQGDGTLVTAHLECVGSTCVAALGPVVADLWQPCVLPQGTSPGTDYRLRVDDPPGYPFPLAPACLTYPSAECLRAARTTLCWGDWHCPSGAYCDGSLGAANGFCKPGPRSPLTVDQLPCRVMPS